MDKFSDYLRDICIRISNNIIREISRLFNPNSILQKKESDLNDLTPSPLIVGTTGFFASAQVLAMARISHLPSAGS